MYSNIIGSDGFGSQFQCIIWTYIYCRFHNLKFYYYPFQSMEHNYENDPNFLYSKEKFINFKENFSIANNDISQLDPVICYPFVQNNINTNNYKIYLDEIKEVFYNDKKNPFDRSYLNIAIHIRVPNKCDNSPDASMWYINNKSYYFNIIENLTEETEQTKPIKFHIYSQGSDDDFKDYNSDNIILHLNESIEETFLSLCYADILVTSKSSFSYIAAMLNNNIVYYTQFWHPPLKDWKIIL
jgi:hypothetical protein